MKLSICSWVFGNQPIEQTMQDVAEMGYDEIEIHAHDYNWDELNTLADELRLTIRGITANAGWPDKTTDLSQTDPAMRKKAVEYFHEQIDRVANAGAEYFVMSPCAPGKSTPEDGALQNWNAAVQSLQELAPYAAANNITLVQEPLNRYESCIINNGAEARRFVKEVNHSSVRTMLDTFHMNIEEKNFEEAFRDAGDALAHIHVADTNRRGINKGRLNWQEFADIVKQSGYNGTITLECLPPGKDPFNPDKGEEPREKLYEDAASSIIEMKQLFL